MTASAEPRAPLADMRAAQDVDPFFQSSPRSQPLLFKKRKLLPHPRSDSFAYRRGPSGTISAGSGGVMSVAGPGRDATTSGAVPRQPSGSQSPRPRPAPRPLEHRPQRIGTGPSMPPTPPAHSRNSSSGHSADLSSPPFADTPDISTEHVQAGPAPSPPTTPRTPTNQRGPPTPDVTPPQIHVAKRPRPPPRPLVSDRIPSRTTTTSGTESFQTARETPYVSEDEDGRSTLRPAAPSIRTSSQSTVRQVNGDAKTKRPKTIGLGLGLESSPDSSATPVSRPRDSFLTFDDEFGADENEVEQQWDQNLERNVTVRKRRPGMNGHTPDEVVEDNTVLPTNATEALRTMSLPERALAFPSPQVTPSKNPAPPAAFTLQRSPEIASRRLSAMSSRSTASTVVDMMPKRQRTLRHVKKVDALRDSSSDLSPSSSATATSVQLEEGARRRPALANGGLFDARHASYASTGTTNSISSRKARREVVKNGGIPVVIVPERRSSLKSNSRTPSLRSTRSSKRSHSVGSAQLLSQVPRGNDLAPYFDRPSRRGRAMSESDGSLPGDQRTMDFPPVVPRRTSSLSAPTSRNTSRAGSLTADSLRELHAFERHSKAQPQPTRSKDSEKDVQVGPPADREDAPVDASEDASPRPAPEVRAPAASADTRPEVRVDPAPSLESVKASMIHPMHKVSIDHHGDPLFGRRLSAQHTPFSQNSVETNGTSNAEVSEAMAVNIYPHQNTSVLMVDHSNKPSLSSESSSSTARDFPPRELLDMRGPPRPPPNPGPSTPTAPAIRTTDTDAGTGPTTPPQPSFSMDDVDSPLRNPRAPPAPPSRLQPPVIEFIPATPSGLTPTQEKEKQLGNFYEMADRPPARRLSLVRRALSLRQSSSHGPTPPRSSGFITRRFSLSRSSSLRREMADERAASAGRAKAPPVMGPDDEPADETRLHPFWRPANAADSESETDSGDEYGADERTYRYPSIDNRPHLPRRSLSERMKRTFAILPIRDDYDHRHDGFPASEPPDSPIRRTVRRTPSGNLRVVGRRASLDSMGRTRAARRGQAAAPGPPNLTTHDGSERRRQFIRWRPNMEPVGGGDGSRPQRRRSLSLFSGTSTGGLVGRLDGYGLQDLPRKLSERRREKRSRELRQKISSPREVRDGVNDVIRRSNYRDACTQARPEPNDALAEPPHRHELYQEGRL